MKATRFAFVLFLVGLGLFGSGCTTDLWERDRFAEFYHAAQDGAADLRFFYSDQRQDILVEYNEVRDEKTALKPRAYWLDENRWRINGAHKPHFVSSDEARDLTPVPILATMAAPKGPDGANLYAIVSTNGAFTVYSGKKELLSGQLPGYYNRLKQTAARLLFTPATVTVDVTTVAVITSPYWAPFVAAYFGHGSLSPYPNPPPPAPKDP